MRYMDLRTSIRRLPWLVVSLSLWRVALPVRAQSDAPDLSIRAHPLEQAASAAPDLSLTANFDLEGRLISQERGWTADAAALRARERAPQIESARAAVKSAAWDVDLQSSGFLPLVTLAAQYKRVNDVRNEAFDPRLMSLLPPGTAFPDFTLPVDNYALTATGRWPVSDLFLRVYPAYQAAQTVVEARKIEVETRAANAELLAREAFYGHARACGTLLVAEQALQQAEAQAALTKRFVDAGQVATVDFTTAMGRVGAMRAAVARSQGAVAATSDTLAVLLDVPVGEVSDIREPVTSLPEPPRSPLPDLVRRGIEQRPELRALRRLLRASDFQRRSERGAAFPSLSVEVAGLHANPNPRYIPPLGKFRSSWEVGATLAWNLNSSLLSHHRSHRVASEQDRARADLRALEDGVAIEVAQAYRDFRTADAVTRACEAQRAAAEEVYRVRTANYRAGAGVQIEMLAADLALTQARLEHVNAVLDARIALARLARATGASGP